MTTGYSIYASFSFGKPLLAAFHSLQRPFHHLERPASKITVYIMIV